MTLDTAVLQFIALMISNPFCWNLTNEWKIFTLFIILFSHKATLISFEGFPRLENDNFCMLIQFRIAYTFLLMLALISVQMLVLWFLSFNKHIISLMNKHINRAFYFQNPDSDSILYNNVNWKKTDLFNNFTNICHKCIKPKCK